MAHPAVAVLESALRARKLDRTLTTTLPPLEWADPSSVLPMDIPRVDGCLRGGLPRGQLSELTGACSSGRMTLLLQLMAAATRRGEIAALVDTHDRLDVASAAAAGVDLDRLLWIRGLGTGGSPKQDPPYRARHEMGTGGWRPPSIAPSKLSISCFKPAGSVSSRSIWQTRRRGAAADSVYDMAAPATRDRGERHGVRAGDAGAAGAQCRRPDVVAGRPLDVGWRVRSQPSVAGARSPCPCRVAAEAD